MQNKPSFILEFFKLFFGAICVSIIAGLVLLGSADVLSAGSTVLTDAVIDHYAQPSDQPLWVNTLPDPATAPSTDHSSVSDTPDLPYTDPHPNAHLAYPAAGHLHGAHAIGTSLDEHPETETWNHGMTYRCNSGLRSFTLPFDKTVDYDGTVISFRDTEENEIEGKPLDITNPNMLDTQQYVTITFTGDYKHFAKYVRSMVVVTADTVYGIHHDDKLINLSPSEITPEGIRLPTSDFAGSGHVESGRFCMEESRN